ncbi:MAG: LysM peptidoglycan-binding domain-containing protein [Anaerolineae bacterium]|nr:LysM peptidoglycan-binding domain-containing protein [Anaerolineae bacterium]
MRSRAWGFLIAVIILAAVVLTVLLIWGGASDLGSPTPMPTNTPLPIAATVENIPPTELPTEIPTPAPLVYIVKEGDTLSSIAQTYGVSIQDIVEANSLANPDMLNIGQELVIPGHFITPAAPPPDEVTTEVPPSESSPTAEFSQASPAPALPTLTPSGPPVVEIWQVLGSGRLTAEMVIVRNRGGLVSLEKWTLSDAEGNIFIFPSLTLFTDGEVRIHSAVGQNTPTNLYWGRTAPAWHSGELITLKDAEGNMVDTYIVP